LALLQTGAGNPIGNLRIKEAADWLAERDGVAQGFTDAEVARRGEGFTEHLASHGLFVAGSSGVQGEWPKLLLTRADDGLLYLDEIAGDAAGSGIDPEVHAHLRPGMQAQARQLATLA